MYYIAMKPITCVFFGKSGSGKGTQASLLVENLKKIDPEHSTTYIETGERLRNFMESSDSQAATLVKEVIDNGHLMPEFFPIWIWSGIFIDVMKADEHVIMDGLARQGKEAPILDSALQFFKREQPIIFLLDTRDEEAKHRLIKRGRHDDLDEKIDKRLRWFETNVMESVQYFEKSPTCRFVKINGEQTTEAVQHDILHVLQVETKK